MSRDRRAESSLTGGGPSDEVRRALLARWPDARVLDESLALDGDFLADLALVHGRRLWLVLHAKRLDRDSAGLACRSAERAHELGPRLARALGADAREARVLLVVHDLLEGGRDALRPAVELGLVLLRRRTLRGASGKHLLLETVTAAPADAELPAPDVAREPSAPLLAAAGRRGAHADRSDSPSPTRRGAHAQRVHDYELTPQARRSRAGENDRRFEPAAQPASAPPSGSAMSSSAVARGPKSGEGSDGSARDTPTGSHPWRPDAEELAEDARRAAQAVESADEPELRFAPGPETADARDPSLAFAFGLGAGGASPTVFGGLPPDESRFVASLEPALAPLGAELVRRQARLDPELHCEPDGERLVWVRRGEVLCSVVAERAALACRLRDGEEPWLLREAIDLETWLDHLLGQLVQRWPQPASEGEPFVIPRPAVGGWLSAAEFEAFRD